MIIEHDHRNVTFSREADSLEEEIETIEQSIINLIHEIMIKIRGRMNIQLKKPQIAKILVSIVLIKIAGTAFSRQGSMKRKVFKLKKQNMKLKSQNRRLQQIITRTNQKKIFKIFRF
ncbi:MAG TPA: hypothetical protein VHP36_07520 [Chitinispirillaceae bacterium]|nr:hypothetical protein [Chitinispirillaceae bacterium]